MKVFFGLLILLLLAFSGYHISFRRFNLPLFARRFYLSGTEFLFLGLLLGPQFFNWVDADTVQRLAPLQGLVLGWIGLIYGFQFEVRALQRFPIEYFIAALLEGAWVFVFVFTAAAAALMIFTASGFFNLWATALVLAAAAACTAHSGLALAAGRKFSRFQKTLQMLRYVSSIDGLVALLLFSAAYWLSSVRAASTPGLWPLWQPTAAVVAVVLVLVVLFFLFLARPKSDQALGMVVIAMAVLTSGAAAAVNFSPLCANFAVGVCLVNWSREKERIYRILIGVEKPLYLLLIVFLGLIWRIETLTTFAFATAYCAWRCFAKISAGYMITRVLAGFKEDARRIGLGLLDHGGLALALLFEYSQSFSGNLNERLVSMMLWAVILNDLLNQYLLRRLLKEVHED